MTDVSRLRELLEEYRTELQQHASVLADSFETLEVRYGALRAVYEGTGAREFRTHWDRTRQAFTSYNELLVRLQPVLTSRIEALAAVDERFGS